MGILSGSIGGTAYTGGLVGLLDGTARVVNCYSYATITWGTTVAGIVGNNNPTTTAASMKTMVMNCMFYGDITGGSTVSPVYGGTNINNLQGGLNTFNYYAYEKLKTKIITSGKYNCALAVEEKYLNRFEFYRLLLNSNKKLAAFYATGSVGWKITAITTLDGDPYDEDNYDYTTTYASNAAYFDYPNYNFADRKSSNKDLYTVSERVFSQGAYFDVPYGVTEITIEPYWAKACYISAPNYDVVYKNDYSGKQNVTQTGIQATPGTTTFNGGQRIENTVSNALSFINKSIPEL